MLYQCYTCPTPIETSFILELLSNTDLEMTLSVNVFALIKNDLTAKNLTEVVVLK